MLCGMLVCVTFGWMGYQASLPFSAARQARYNNDLMQHEIQALQFKNQQLALEIESLKTPEGRRLAARRIGWMYPYERPLRIPGN